MCRPLCGHHPGGVKKKIFIWSGGTSFYKERVVETCDGRHHPMVVVEDDVLAEPWVGEQVGCLGSKLKSNRKSSRDICDGGWDILWGVIERFWVELREKAWDRRQLEGRPFELGKENWSKRGINTQKDRLDRRKYRYCFYKLQFYFFSCPCHFIVFSEYHEILFWCLNVFIGDSCLFLWNLSLLVLTLYLISNLFCGLYFEILHEIFGFHVLISF